VHPDRHPSERAELAKRVTQELLALKPFVLPKAKPRDVSPVVTAATNCGPVTPRTSGTSVLARHEYPCAVCKHTVPSYYCGICRDKFDKIKASDRERREARRARYNERQRELRKWRKSLKRPKACAACEQSFKPERKDSKFCSQACRQRAYRQRVTDVQNPDVNKLTSRNGECQQAAA
jgi:hypothetical protein